MSTTAIPEDRVSSGHDVRFRIPRDVATAASAVAQRELISLSDVARRALVADLRNRGLLFRQPGPRLAPRCGGQ